MGRVQITSGETAVTATLNETPTARAVAHALPIESTARRWGREIFFETPLELPEDQPVPDVPSGTVAYWPTGRAVCLFFGERPYSSVNVIGQLDGDPTVLADVSDGAAIRMSLAGDGQA